MAITDTDWIRAAVVFGATVLGTCAAVAADKEMPSDSTLQEVVVTAQKRAEDLDRVPISMAVLSSDDMAKQSIQDLNDIVAFSPGVDFQSTGFNSNTNNNAISIRGIYSNTGFSTTGIYIDDVPIQVRFTAGNEWITVPKVFDLDRVEVLRGPQGTLFGAGAEGGVIRFVTPEPSLTQESGYARAGAGTTDNGGPSYEAGFAAGGPLIQDELGFRVSAWHRRDGGFIDHNSPIPGGYRYDNSNWSDSDVIRAAIAFSPISQVKITPSLYYQHLYLNDEPTFAPAGCPESPCDTYTTQFQGLPLRYSNVGNEKFVNPNLLRSPANDRLYIPALKADINIGNIEVVSSTSYMDRRSFAPTDWTTNLPGLLGLPWPRTADFTANFSTSLQQQVFSQELRVQSAGSGSPLQWTVGAFFSRSRESTLLQIPTPGLANLLGAPVEDVLGTGLLPGGLVFKGTEPDTVDRQTALFAQATYQVTHQLSFTAGIRGAQTKTDYSVIELGPLVGGMAGGAGEQSQRTADPRFGINLQLDENTLLYASAAKGDRIGGVNTSGGVTTPQCQAAAQELGISGRPNNFTTDYLWSYELGSKNKLLERRLEIQASLFYINWSNVQQPINIPACGGPLNTNLGAVVSKGGDLNLDFLLSDSLKLRVSAAYTDARQRDTISTASAQLVTKGDQINPFSTPWTLVGSADYNFAISGDYKGYLRVDDVYHSRNPGPFAPLQSFNASYVPGWTANPATNELNVHLGVTWNRWDHSVYALNALNSHPVLFNSEFEAIGSPASAYTVRPLTIGFTSNYRW